MRLQRHHISDDLHSRLLVMQAQSHERKGAIKLAARRLRWEIVKLSAIRGLHPAIPNDVAAGYPGTEDDVLALTTDGISLLLHLRPLILQQAGKRVTKGFVVIGGLNTWQVLQPWHAARMHLESIESIRLSGQEPIATQQVSTPNAGKARSRGARSVLEPHIEEVPALVISSKLDDDDIARFALAERWLLAASVAPKRRLGRELIALHGQAMTLGLIDELTPKLRTFTALARVLDVTTQGLRKQRSDVDSSDDGADA